MDDANRKTKSCMNKILGDVSKCTATKQVILGTSSGWATGYVAGRVGKTAAIALGGSIILLQIASEKGYLKINWNKVNKGLDKVSDKVEEKLTGEQPGFLDKAERLIDRKLDKAESSLKSNQEKAKKWWSGDQGCCNLKEVHIFLVSFAAGVAIGLSTA